MRPSLPKGAAAALAPVREALRAEADALAEATGDDARRHAAEVRTDARERARRILDQARAEGEQQARVAVSVELTRRRREARDILLAAQRELYDELRQRCRDAALELRDAADYPQLRRALSERATAVLGPDASVQESPAGGVVAVAPSRRLDLSLTTLADREVERLGSAVERLWAQ
jgi:vacuolar-type H+-ATPase subunit E/Vma4